MLTAAVQRVHADGNVVVTVGFDRVVVRGKQRWQVHNLRADFTFRMSGTEERNRQCAEHRVTRERTAQWSAGCDIWPPKPYNPEFCIPDTGSWHLDVERRLIVEVRGNLWIVGMVPLELVQPVWPPSLDTGYEPDFGHGIC